VSDDQRTRILTAALDLMAEKGARGMSMRSLAAVCGLNVATLYHYFPSKTDLVSAAIAHGRLDSLFEAPFPAGLTGSVDDRLGALLESLCLTMIEDDRFWRAVLAEAIHGDAEVLTPVLEMSAAFEAALGHWIAELLPDAPALHAPEVVRSVRHAFYGVLVEHLPQSPGARERAAAAVRQVAGVFARLQTPAPRSASVSPTVPPTLEPTP
jgi:AcrR family transcriptional regulator